MRNKKVYEMTNEKPLSLDILQLQARWKRFGHILRQNESTPAFKSMTYSFCPSKNTRFRRQPRTTLPVTLSMDLQKATKHNQDFLQISGCASSGPFPTL